MFETAFALGLTQFARTLSMPERVRQRTARNAALEPWRLRNTGVDALYYDVKALTADETFYISDSLASEGLIMIVPPSGGPMLTLCDSVEEYRLRGGLNVHALAVAGMGGSAIGAAAFARNVANAIGQPVAAVVSGYGLGDIVNEAIGGAFLFGWLGHIRSNLEVIDDVVGRPKLGAYGKREEDGDGKKSRGLDADTVASLLADPTLSFTLITGHSRGNRVIADALHALKASDPGRLETLSNTARIVTFGGRIKMPEAFTDITDVVGELDWFGELNSRPKIATDIRVPFCGHSTNTDLPGAIKVTKILTDILAGHPEQTEERVEIVPPAVSETVKQSEDIVAAVTASVAEPVTSLAVDTFEAPPVAEVSASSVVVGPEGEEPAEGATTRVDASLETLPPTEPDPAEAEAPINSMPAPSKSVARKTNPSAANRKRRPMKS